MHRSHKGSAGERPEQRWPKGSEEMLEAALRDALSPASLPDGFAARVRAKVAKRQRERAWTRIRHGAVAAVLLLAVLFGGWGLEVRRERHNRAEAAQASQQFELAMQVTVRSLSRVSSNLQHLENRGGTR